MNGKTVIALAALILMLLGGTAGTTAGQLAQSAGEQKAQASQVAVESQPLVAQGSAFTYQGRLVVGGNPASGSYDITFSLFDAVTGGNQIGSTITVLSQTLSIGTFTDPLDFGTGAFQGDSRWLQIGVRPSGTPTYTILSPRQALTPAPYALGLKPGASVSGALPSQILSINNSQTGNTTNSGLQVTTASGGAIDALGVLQGVYGQCSATGCTALGGNAIGAYGTGVAGHSVLGTGIQGQTDRGGTGIFGLAAISGTGVSGLSTSGLGVRGESLGNNGTGVYGASDTGATSKGVNGASVNGFGGYFTSTLGTGLSAISSNGTGINGSGATFGVSSTGGQYGLYASGGSGNSGTGVFAVGGQYGIDAHSGGTGVSAFGVDTGLRASGDSYGVYSTGGNNYGVYGQGGIAGGYFVGNITYGVYGSGQNVGVYATSPSTGVYARGSLWAGNFQGNVNVTGSCCFAGAGTYKIDDPADPANKYLNESAVASPDMLNIYSGNVTTDDKGDAVVALPDYFEALNTDFRYQLTVMGQFAQAIVSEEITGNHFSIKTDKPGVKVSWQVTGVRHDPYAEQHALPAEQAKTGDEQGKYLYPAEYGQPASMGVDYGKNEPAQPLPAPQAPQAPATKP